MGINIGPGISIGVGGYTWIPIGVDYEIPSAIILPVDAYFNYVPLLLSSNNTANGAQNNTFLDSSVNNLPITRGGSAIQGSTNPFGVGNWSTSFSGSGQYLDFDGASLALGTGDFTIEMWIYANSYGQGATDSRLAGSQNSGNAGWQMAIRNSGTINFGSWLTATDSTLLAPVQTWNHIAWTRESGVEKLYINGALSNTVTRSLNMTTTAASIGRVFSTNNLWNGYVSNFRIVKGTAVYTSAFTPPTSPLTAITNTVFLTCQSNRFADNSTNVFTVTPTGAPTVERFNPFGIGTPYAKTVYSGSVYFNGSTDYLSATTSASFAFPGDFTVEFWVNPTSFNQYGCMLDTRTVNSNATGFYIRSQSVFSSGQWQVSNGTASFTINASTNLTANTWQHIALVRSGTTLTLYLNGSSVGSATVAQNFSDGGLRIFNAIDNYYFPGYISNLRLVKGVAVYTAAFTPPTLPLGATQSANVNGNPSAAITGTQTSLLLSGANSGIYDGALQNNVQTAGNAQVSTSVVKYGTGSIAFDGTTSYLTMLASPSLAFGSGNWTVEMWLYALVLPTNPASAQLYDTRPASTNGAYPLIYLNNDGTIRLWVSSADRISSSAISTGQWYHVAVSRSNGSTKMFINGTQTGSTYTDSTVYLASDLRVGASYSGGASISNYLNGYIQDLRVTKGVARYTATFTPPTAALPTYGPQAPASAPYTLQYLVVAGGGSGGNYAGGGGGAGGLTTGSTLVSVGTVYTITVGAGGAGVPGPINPSVSGNPGSTSSITSPSFIVTTLGGGGGGGVPTGRPGGSGGGGGGYNSTGGTGIPGQGFPGGNNSNSSGAGGGGATQAGGDGLTPTGAGGGKGGAGYTWIYTGNTYAGGGSGGFYPATIPTPGGVGGGGYGAAANSPQSPAGGAGTPGTGGGGGGVWDCAPTTGAGGGGVVILAVPTTSYPGGYAPIASTPASAPGMTVLTYTSSGSYTA